MATNYDIIDDEKVLTQIETDKQQELTDLENTYGDMEKRADKYFQDQINASKEWADKQTEIQNQQTDFTIEKINQQKEQAQKDYTKEQSGAYADWQKQSNQYGANAEKMAAQGMAGTGFSESSRVSMYTAYQNRIATAREIFNQATLNYNNAIKDAKLQNSSVLAEIAYNAYKEQAELGIKAAMYKDELLREKTNKELEIKNMYHNQWMDVLGQINIENARAEEVRQFNEKMALEKAAQAEQVRQFNILHSGSGGSGSGTISGGSSGGSSKGSSKSSKKPESPISKSNKWKETEKGLKKDEGNKSSGGVDMQSVLSLGYGPISAERAWELVKEGLAETYVKDGKTYFRKSSKYLKQKKLFGF